MTTNARQVDRSLALPDAGWVDCRTVYKPLVPYNPSAGSQSASANVNQTAHRTPAPGSDNMVTSCVCSTLYAKHCLCHDGRTCMMWVTALCITA